MLNTHVRTYVCPKSNTVAIALSNQEYLKPQLSLVIGFGKVYYVVIRSPFLWVHTK